MQKISNINRQGNKYDKIFRENMEIALPGIIKNILGLKIVRSIELPDDIQYTKERKPDLLKKVTDKTGKNYVLHLEYQSQNDKEMVYRMANYSAMLLWRYKLPVKQYVIFIGKGKARMEKNIITENFKFHYDIIALSSVNYKIFLKSDKPEVKILAILANFEKDKPVVAIENILQQVKVSAKGNLAESRYFNQLRVLVQLRNLENQFNKAMESITSFFKEEKDPLFRRGEAKGREEVVSNLIEKLGFSDEQVADVSGVPLSVVKKIRKKLQNKNDH